MVALQTDAFHSPAPLAALDGMARKFFEAEVLSEMQKKIRFNPDELFASLVIEPSNPTAVSGNGSKVIGGVEVSYVGQKDILCLLEPGTEGYCYIASMVVAPTWRRRGAAAALLAAAEAAVELWDERQAVLHVYQDNIAAVQLYQKQGYEVILQEKGGLAAMGRRPRFLMRKRW
ncbi:hypothetical protein COHA_009326 [Chlorella ohadii]|uniref:N-acetyltransferase domain-containing protein n=1 Tax=Chlorella ohadii TaxID=2649997 RepID=A0AAD5H1M5_9CHLO|nr:hypothetical protein COHA_009326 [Chlorella ohadii]